MKDDGLPVSGDPLAPLIRALYHSGGEQPRKAAEALRQRGEPGGQLSVETLVQLLMRDNTPLRSAAADILREWGEYVPIEPLLLAMRDSDEEVRISAKWALAEAGKHAPPERLLAYFEDPDTAVRIAVLYALGTHAPVASVLEAVCAPEEGLREAAAYLVGLLKEQVPVESLIDMLRKGEAPLRATAANALGNLGEPIPIEPLIEALHDADTGVRLRAVRALANTGERMPKAVLLPLLDDHDQSIRYAAAKALVRVGEPLAVAIMVDSLHADHEFARENAQVHLVQSTETEMQEIARHLPIQELLHLLPDEWWPVGYMAARIIAQLGEDTPLDALLALIGHPVPEARWATLYALALLGKHIPLSERIPIEPVLAALDAEDVETRRGAAEVLDYFGPQAPIDRLLPLLEVEDTQIARVLAKRGRQEGIDALVASLRTIDYAGHAAGALGELGERAPIEPLLAALHHSDRTVRHAVAGVLYKTHPEILPELVTELVETLGAGDVGSLLEPLRHVLVVQALAMLKSPQPAIVERFDDSLDAPDWEVRTRAALGLSWAKPAVSEATIKKLRQLLDDPESASVRKAARYALDACTQQ